MKPLRVGIDVGGTFTKAVALADRRLIAQARVPTTHDAAHGVADGVVAALRALTASLGERAGDVALVAHSTTQATNALLEGDVDRVGIIAMGPAAERVQILRRTTPGAIALAPGKALATATQFVPTCAGEYAAGEFDAALEALRRAGAQAFAVTAAFGVDHPEGEAAAADRVRQTGAPVTAGHELTGAYG
ncbi:MAG TPA: glutamate mutase L, partial [Limnochordia bacterium]|nr:glutamate mutase L [Limnochordia bacterium]